MSTFKKINLRWGSIMDFFIAKLELFLISTNLGYNGGKKNKNKNVCSIHLFIFFPNPLLNAFLAGILWQPFFYHTR